MHNIKIISSSIRTGRKSHRIALYLQNFINKNYDCNADILDLKEYQFPVFAERLKFQSNPDQKVIDFADKIKSADGVIIVTPEYNGGYPASLINIIDLLVSEWYHKPVAISTVSDGVFGGSQVITSLQFSLWKLKALTVTAMFPVPKVDDNFNEQGEAVNADMTDKRAIAFIKELLWFIEASKTGNS